MYAYLQPYTIRVVRVLIVARIAIVERIKRTCENLRLSSGCTTISSNIGGFLFPRGRYSGGGSRDKGDTEGDLLFRIICSCLCVYLWVCIIILRDIALPSLVRLRVCVYLLRIYVITTQLSRVRRARACGRGIKIARGGIRVGYTSALLLLFPVTTSPCGFLIYDGAAAFLVRDIAKNSPISFLPSRVCVCSFRFRRVFFFLSASRNTTMSDDNIIAIIIDAPRSWSISVWRRRINARQERLPSTLP